MRDERRETKRDAETKTGRRERRNDGEMQQTKVGDWQIWPWWSLVKSTASEGKSRNAGSTDRREYLTTERRLAS
jgi:hypothetical protein